MKFTKMHGLGNDYVYVDMRTERLSQPSATARLVSDRHTGIGADGLILMYPSDSADVRMEMYNADGSRAQMCGNGIRCVAKYAVEHGFAAGPELRIETDDGVKNVLCVMADGAVQAVRADMGVPMLNPSSLPSTVQAERMVDYSLEAGGTVYTVTCVSMGNPHAVLFVDHLDDAQLRRTGPVIEQAPQFPQRINVHLVQVRDSAHVSVLHWERGSGATRACGTGACAVCVAGVISGRSDKIVTVTLPGGDLQIEWASDDHVYMTGPAVEAYRGEWNGGE